MIIKRIAAEFGAGEQRCANNLPGVRNYVTPGRIISSSRKAR